MCDVSFRVKRSAPHVGMWVVSGSTVVAEICAGAELDWLLIDGEHAPNDLQSIQAQLQVCAAYPVDVMVRVPVADEVLIKQYLDLGALNLLVPMVNTPEQAAEVARACAYPPEGIRGVGSALARSGRWGRTKNYLQTARDNISVTVQIESAMAVENAAGIIATPGVDALFIGPSDLAASMGLLGQQNHPQVTEAVLKVIELAIQAGKPVGVNAFDPQQAATYCQAGVDFILTGADVGLLVQGSNRLATEAQALKEISR